MDDCTPLLQKLDVNKKQESNYNTRVKVMCYVMINSIGILISSSGQTKYIYSYIKSHDKLNNSSNSTEHARFKHQKHLCGDNLFDDSHTQAKTSFWTWSISAIQYGFALPIMVCVGPMIDSIGRKPLLLWNVTVTCLAFILKTIIAYYKFRLEYFIMCSCLLGLSGTYFTFHLVCLSILADTTSKGNQRTMAMAIYRAVMAIGGFFAYVGMGYLSEIDGFPYPFAISSVIFFFFVIVVTITFKDTWQPKTNLIESRKFTSSVEIFVLCKERVHVRRNIHYLISYYAIFFLYMLPFAAKDSVKTIYLLGPPFCWHPQHFGWYSAISGIIIFMSGPIILKVLHILIKTIKDEVILIAGLMSATATYLLLGFASNDGTVYDGKMLETDLVKMLEIICDSAIYT